MALRGVWTVYAEVPPLREVVAALRDSGDRGDLRFDLSGVSHFDSVLVTFVLRVGEEAQRLGFSVDRASVPRNVRRLIDLAQSAPALPDAGRKSATGSWLARVGEQTIALYSGCVEVTAFIGEWTLSLGRLLKGSARMRAKDVWMVLESVSVSALPIVSLISFLIGVIISFLGAVTLKDFGAEFAVAYLVGYGMLREMGAVMTGIIMAGRTGAAFAAQIGSMKVNEEIDALRTFGISPIDFIVLPRVLALFIMVPVLTLYANVIGIASGWLVAEFVMGVPGAVFFGEMTRVVGIGDFALGIFKAAVFGLLIGTAGCLRGLQSGSGADAVGLAATRAVVTGITLIIFANAVIDWAATILDL